MDSTEEQAEGVRPEAVEAHPVRYGWRSRFDHISVLDKMEGGGIYAGIGEGAYWIVTDEGTMADFLPEEDHGDLIRLKRYDDRHEWERALVEVVERAKRRFEDPDTPFPWTYQEMQQRWQESFDERAARKGKAQERGREVSMAEGYFLLNTDGGMVNDGQRDKDAPAGEAAVAVVVRQVVNGREVLIDGFSGAIGPAKNGVAEYRALIEGLRYVLDELQGREVRAYVDSEFVVEQMNSVSGVDETNYYSTSKPRKQDIKDLHAEARELANRFKSIRISWIPRERNGEADGLAKLALPH